MLGFACILTVACATVPATSNQSGASVMLEYTFSQQSVNADQGVQPETWITLITSFFLIL